MPPCPPRPPRKQGRPAGLPPSTPATSSQAPRPHPAHANYTCTTPTNPPAPRPSSTAPPQTYSYGPPSAPAGPSSSAAGPSYTYGPHSAPQPKRRTHAAPKRKASGPAPTQPKRPRQIIDLNSDAEDDTAAHEVIDLTQPDYGEDWEHYGHIDAKVVGVRYYAGIATVGEQVFLTREKDNQYDSNAIRVDNITHTQIGHIPRLLASKLAPLIDASLLHPEGVVAGRAGEYDMPLTIDLYGSANPQTRIEIKAAIRNCKLPIRASEEQKRGEAAELAAAQSSQSGAAAIEVEVDEFGEYVGGGTQGLQREGWGDILDASVPFNPRELGEVVQKFGISEADLAAYESAGQPERLATKMLPYQLQGLAWLLRMENPVLPAEGKEMVQLWRRISGAWQNGVTMFTMREAPELAVGGVLADDMGLGKTLQMVALIVADVEKEKELVPVVRKVEGCTGGTLVVCPVGVMSNWTGQIKHHVSDSAPLKVLVYHGPTRDCEDLSNWDVVITSYGTLTSEHGYKKAGKPAGLHAISWCRVILDEAHQIRNPLAKSSLAATALTASSRWCLTGTPIINTLKDLYSLLRFLRFPGGLAELDIFNRMLIRPLNKGLPEASARLQALMASICLRRTKDMGFIDLELPPCSEFVHKIAFYPDELQKYNVLELEAKGLLERYTNGRDGEKKDDYRFLLEILLRMRQACNHWTLCGARIESLMKLAGMEKVVLNEENMKALQDLLQIAVDSQEECCVCLEVLKDPRITICKHIFDLECIEKVIELQHKCPMCRCNLPSPMSTLIGPPTTPDPTTPTPSNLDPSSKIDALLKILNATRSKDPSIKTIIFSQWTSFLALLTPHLTAAGFKITRIDGTMSARARDAALTTLESDPKCTVMLASLAATSVGLNLVAASQVILADSWWAPAIEDQAVDRVHRLGQKRETTVFRLVMEGSVEERVLGVQERKRGLVATAFAERRGRGREARLMDLQMLVGAGTVAGAGAGGE